MVQVAGKILLIDDDEYIRKLVKIYLSKKNYLIKTCSNGSEALEVLGIHKENKITQSFQPNLMLVDVSLPDMEGYDFFITCQKNKTEFYDIPCIFMSGQFIDEEDILKGLNIGAYDYMCKPLNLDILLSKVKNCIHFYTSKHQDNEMNVHQSDNQIFNIKEAARFFNVTEKTVYNLVHKGKIPALKIGGQWRFSKNVLEKMFLNVELSN